MIELRIFLWVCLLAFAPLSAAAQSTLTQARWIQHLKEDLIPYLTTPDALGDPVGLYPSMRCNDGSAFDEQSPCPEIASIKWMTPDQKFIIVLSRQAYAYLVMLHMTGDRKYLELGKAGVDVILKDARDELGGTYERYDIDAELWWHEDGRFYIQKQSYALLAPTFYYYLTRDPAVFAEIEEIRQSILSLHKLDDAGHYAWKRKGESEKARRFAIMAYLDQLNTFYTLLAPIALQLLRAAWLAETDGISRNLRDFFLQEETQLFHLSGAKQRGEKGRPKADFGHAVKSHWFLIMNGQLANDQLRIEASREGGMKVLNSSFNRKAGAWSNGFRKTGKPYKRRDSWIFAEQN